MTHVTARSSEDDFGNDPNALVEFNFHQGTSVDAYSGHSGPSVESHVTVDASSVRPGDDSGKDLDALMEFELLRGPAIRGTTGFGFNIAGQVGIGLALSELSGFKFAGAATRQGIRLPRRIDLEEQHVEVVVPYITFTRATSKSQHFERLGLSTDAAKALSKDLKAYFGKPENYCLLSGRPDAKSAEGKMTLLRSSFHLLKTEGLGAKYFGLNRPRCRQTRTICWPDDSTLIVYNFALFLYKSIDLEKSRRRTMAKAVEAQSGVADGSKNTPIDLCGVIDDYPSPQPCPRLSVSPVIQSVEPLTPQTPDSLVSHPPIRHPSTVVQRAAAANSPAPLSTSQMCGAGGLTLDMQNPPASQSIRDQQHRVASAAVGFDLLAQEISRLKRHKRYSSTLPSDANLRFRFSFKDRDDGQVLRPAVIFQQSEELTASDAFTFLQQSFAAVATPATVMVNTPLGAQWVNNRGEWDAAIRSVWEFGGTGSRVEVDVLV